MLAGTVRELVEARNLEIHFMPIVRLTQRQGGSSWRTMAFEALVRGPEGHPLRHPAELFRAADAEHVRQELEVLCVESALRHRAELPADARLFLNVGLTTFLSEPFMEALWAHRREAPGAGQTVVELVEDEMPSSRTFRDRLALLEAAGYEVALDDLTADADTLRRLIEAGPVRYWKLDRSVLEAWMHRAGWVRDWLPMLTSTARAMGIEVVIEGLENVHLRHLPALCDAGVSLGQGFIFGKPAILGPGLSLWRGGLSPMIPTGVTTAAEGPNLVPLRVGEGLRDLYAVIRHLPFRNG